MKVAQFVQVALAMVGICCCLAAPVKAQSAQTEPGQSSAAPTPVVRMYSQPIPRAAIGQRFAPSRQQAAPAPRRSWVARHKVLTAVLIGAAPFVVWGAVVWQGCSGGGC